MKKSQANKMKNIGAKVFAMALAAIMIFGALAGSLIYIFS